MSTSDPVLSTADFGQLRAFVAVAATFLVAHTSSGPVGIMAFYN